MILSRECVSVPTVSPVSTVKDISKVYKECYAGQLSCLKKYHTFSNMTAAQHNG